MSYDQYNMVFMIGLVMAGVFLLLSVLLLFVLRIPAVIGYLSGSTERKAISEIRKGNAKGHADAAGGDPQIAVSHTANLGGTGAGGAHSGNTTASLSKELSEAGNAPEEKTSVLSYADAAANGAGGEETAVLREPVSAYAKSEETAVLREPVSVYAKSEETAVLGGPAPVNAGAAETAVLYEETGAGTIVSDDLYTEQTTVLGGGAAAVQTERLPNAAVDFKIVAEVVLFVSTEIIA